MLKYSGSDGQLNDELEKELSDWNTVYVDRRSANYREIDGSSVGDKDDEIRRLREVVDDLNEQLTVLGRNNVDYYLLSA